MSRWRRGLPALTRDRGRRLESRGSGGLDYPEAFFPPIDEAVTGEPVDAKFATDGKKAWVVPSKPGTKLDPEKTAEAATEAALKTTGRTLVVTLTEKEAELTTEKAEAMGIKDLLGSHTATPYAGSANRQHNVRITTQDGRDVEKDGRVLCRACAGEAYYTPL